MFSYNCRYGEYIKDGTTNTTTNGSTNSLGVYRITTDELNVRKGAGTVYPITAKVYKGQAYTITEIKYNGSTPWGKLKSGVGWISLNSKYVEKVK